MTVETLGPRGIREVQQAESAESMRRANAVFERITSAIPPNLLEGVLTDSDGDWHFSLVYENKTGGLVAAGLRRFGLGGEVSESHSIDNSGNAVYKNPAFDVDETGVDALSKAEERWNSVLKPSEAGRNPRIIVHTLLEDSILTTRETEILREVAKGGTNLMIGQRLGIEEQTVKNYVTSILRKTRSSDRTAAVMWGLRTGFLGFSRKSDQSPE